MLRMTQKGYKMQTKVIQKTGKRCLSPVGSDTKQAKSGPKMGQNQTDFGCPPRRPTETACQNSAKTVPDNTESRWRLEK